MHEAFRSYTLLGTRAYLPAILHHSALPCSTRTRRRRRRARASSRRDCQGEDEAGVRHEQRRQDALTSTLRPHTLAA